MTGYYVTHPNLDLTAIVYAPTTEKARTTFLDYLERSGVLARGSRGSFRQNMIAEKLGEPGSVNADIELHYGYVEPEVPITLAREPAEEEVFGGPEEEEIEQVPEEPEQVVAPQLSPIQ